MPQDLHILPRIRDSWSYVYCEHARIDQDAKAIAIHDATGKTLLPCAQLHLLLLGPGTSITHAAVRVLMESGCSIVWTGEQGVRCYAQGMGETRSAQRFLHQARLWADADAHLGVVRAMYQMRFPDPLEPSLTLQQIRGKEGIRVRNAYAHLSEAYGVVWHGRNYQRDHWDWADPVNRALSAANACMYGVCHAAIVAAGYSPALGFIHTGKLLSFVYDVADLYKMEIATPAAFAAVAAGTELLERRVRQACREKFKEEKLLARIVSDLDRLLTASDEIFDSYSVDSALPGYLWDPDGTTILGGVNFDNEEEVAQ